MIQRFTIGCSLALLSGMLAAQSTSVLGDARLIWETSTDVTIPTSGRYVDVVTLNGVAFAVGSTDGYRTELLVTASDPLSGATLWSHVYDDGSGTEHAAVSVQVTAGVVVVGGERYLPGSQGNTGLLLGLDSSDGALLWSRDEGPVTSSIDAHSTSFPELELAGTQGQLLALESYAKVPLMTFESTPDTDESLHLVDAATGQSLWEVATYGLHDVGEIELSPDGTQVALVGSFVKISLFGDLPKFDYVAQSRHVVDGSTSWTTTLQSNLDFSYGPLVWSCLAFEASGQRLLVGGNAPTTQLYGLSPADGSVLWSAGEAGFNPQRLGVDDAGRVLVAGTLASQLRVHAFDEGTGAALWSATGASTLRIDDLLVDSASKRAVIASGDDYWGGSDAWQLTALETTTGATSWESVQGANDGQDDWAAALAPGTATGSVLVAGERNSPGEGVRGLLETLSLSGGGLLGEDWYDGHSIPADQKVQVSLLSADALTLYTGGSRGTLSIIPASPPWPPEPGTHSAYSSWLVASHTSNGQTRWVREFDPDVAFTLQAMAAEPAQGMLLIGGHLDGARSQVSALDSATGLTLWQQHLDNHVGTDSLRELDVVPGGGLVIATTQTNDELGAVALDLATGALLWSRTEGVADGDHHARTLVQSDGARAFLLGTSYVSGGNMGDVTVTALDPPSGEVLWQKSLDSDGTQASWDADHLDDALLSSDDAALFVYSWVHPDAQFNDASSWYRLDTQTGNVDWALTLPTPTPGASLRPRRLTSSPDGATLYGLSTYWDNWLTQSIFLMVRAVDAGSGQLLWTQTHPTGAWLDQNGYEITCSRDGASVLVVAATGASYPDAQGLTAAFDADSGAPLWSAVVDGAALAEESTRGLAVLPDGRRILTASQSGLDPLHRDLLLQAFELPKLTGVPDALSLQSGGSQSFDLSGGVASAGQMGFLVGSLSGTSPGIDLGGGLILPLVFDAYTDYSVKNPNTPLLSGSFSGLDGQGHAEASLNLPPGMSAGLAGLSVHHAWVGLDPSGATFASNPVALLLQP